jgi:hypothetical protein
MMMVIVMMIKIIGHESKRVIFGTINGIGGERGYSRETGLNNATFVCLKTK